MNPQRSFAEVLELLHTSFLEQFNGDEEAANLATATALTEIFLGPDPPPQQSALMPEKKAA